MLQQRCLSLAISLYIIVNFLPCLSYDRELNFHGSYCDYEIHKLTQYQVYLITWSGSPFTVWCSAGFMAENPYNVHTNYKVCVKVLDQYFDECIPKVEFYDGFGAIWASERYDCHKPLPTKWCTKARRPTRSYLSFKVIAKERSSSYLRVEISVEADVSLTIAAAVGIALGSIGGLILLCCCCACMCGCCKDEETPQTNPTPDNAHENNYDYRQHAQLQSSNLHNLNEPDNSQIQTGFSTYSDEHSAGSQLLRDEGRSTPATGASIPMQTYSYGAGNLGHNIHMSTQNPSPSAPPLPSAMKKCEEPPPSYHSLFSKS